jgi:hypothetical protein
MKKLEEYKYILDNINDYVLLKSDLENFYGIYHIKSDSDVLINTTEDVYEELFAAMKSLGVRIVDSVDEVRDTSIEQFHMRWDAEKKEFVKVFRNK